MRSVRDIAAGALLKLSPQLSILRRVPVLGGLLHRVGYRAVPREVLVWRQIQTGEAQGLWLLVNPRTGSDYCRGAVEAAVQRCLAEYLRPGAVFYDIGANIGFFSLLAARKVGPTGKVFAFEPETEAFARLQQNAARNGLVNISIVDAAVWSTSGTAAFSRCSTDLSPDRGLGKVGELGVESGGLEVGVVALDDFIRTAPPPHMIKCDVEGAELEVLRGAEKLLAQHKPKLICEIHSPENLLAVHKHLAAFGYSISQLDGNHVAAI